MSNAAAAYYLYLARKDREREEVLRRAKYYASADYVAARAANYERIAAREAKRRGPHPLTDAALSSMDLPDTSDLHTTSYVDSE